MTASEQERAALHELIRLGQEDGLYDEPHVACEEQSECGSIHEQ